MSKEFHPRLEGPGFTLGTWCCDHDHTSPGAEQCSVSATINVVLDGAFVRHVGRRAVVADPSVAVLAPAGEAWRSSHPRGARPDRGVWVLLDPDRVPLTARAVPLAAPTWRAWAEVARSGDAELGTALVAELIEGPGLPLREPWAVTRARRHLAERLADPPDLAALAAEVRVSPWHLARLFRAATGLTPRGYAERLRLAAAARAVERGERDLSSLACTLGFSSHSHLTARFRATFGEPPSGLRARSVQ